MWWLALVIFVLFTLLLHLVTPKKYNWSTFERTIRKIPGPCRIPYFGSLTIFVYKPDQLLDLIINLNDHYRPLGRLEFLGHFYVILSDVNDIKVILNTTDNITKAEQYDFVMPWLGTGLLTSTGQKWHNHRKWLTPAFHFKILDQYVDTISNNANILVRKLMEHVKDDYVNINHMVSLCTLDIICETAMGVVVGAQTGGEKEFVNATLRMSQLFNTRIFSPWLRTEWVFKISPTGREQQNVLKILHGFTERVIKERKAIYRQKEIPQLQDTADLHIGKKGKKSFLDLLIESSGTDNKITEENIRNEVDTFMFEGHDTTSAAICWALLLLGSNLEIQEKAFQELKEIFGDSYRDPTVADLSEMKYLERVIKETLRLYPSVPLIGRKLDVDVKIKDYVIPAGTNLGIPTYCIHRDEKYFPDPTKFDPERFSPEATQGRHPFSYIPFSGGPRNCIGQRFAMMEEKIILSQILRKFQFTTLDAPENVKPVAELILRPKDNIRIMFKPR